MKEILYAVLVLGIMGAVFGAVLAIASKVFAVKTDERLPKLIEALPGANCGGCGYPGCAGCAAAILAGNAPVNACAPAGPDNAAAIAEIMGVEATASEPMKAVVTCSGTCDKTSKRYEFDGIHSCQAVKGLYGGDGLCKFGCLGYGDCVEACKFNAIGIVNGVAKNTFAPDDSITREQIAAMLYRYAGAEAAKEDKLSAFPDAAKVSDWAKEALNWAVASGLINGVADANGTANLEPQSTATRAQIATILMRFCEMSK